MKRVDWEICVLVECMGIQVELVLESRDGSMALLVGCAVERGAVPCCGGGRRGDGRDEAGEGGARAVHGREQQLELGELLLGRHLGHRVQLASWPESKRRERERETSCSPSSSSSLESREPSCQDVDAPEPAPARPAPEAPVPLRHPVRLRRRLVPPRRTRVPSSRAVSRPWRRQGSTPTRAAAADQAPPPRRRKEDDRLGPRQGPTGRRLWSASHTVFLPRL